MSDKMISILQPNADIVRIIILFLEKYEILSDQDRKSIGLFVKCASNPPLIYNVSGETHETT